MAHDLGQPCAICVKARPNLLFLHDESTDGRTYQRDMAHLVPCAPDPAPAALRSFYLKLQLAGLSLIFWDVVRRIGLFGPLQINRGSITQACERFC